MLSPISVVVGTRPEAIKLAPVVAALRNRRHPLQLVFTGQHPLRDGDFGLGGAACHLGMPSFGHPRRYADALALRLAPIVRAASLVIVQFDTSSALAGALAAEAAGVPLAHVEAGLRSFDRTMPWPEEEFRIEIDERADLLFAPTQTSATNLRRERVAGTIHVTGNTAIDALLQRVADLPPASPPALPYILVTCHRRESWGGAQAAIALALAALARRGDVEVRLVLHPNPRVRSTMIDLLGKEANLRLLDPLDHAAMLQQMRNARLLLSDSGGIQEEAPALGIPLLVLRDRTERPEAIATGNMLLVGTDVARILGAATRVLSDPAVHETMSRPSFPYGDGRSGERIADLLVTWLAARDSKAQERRRA
ncbi:UDP-N-acetylglucosamine 2-epimerase (non-hydrolyzing) [Sphingomonas ginkgonis]|uniref:UDP-N-acetylglucosamine 2-epimerase (Non-hydrolyzing) n=1 Tax=Sphingomonas ginkgonis TaxID=2315330 RepID=A0A3R9WR45_9SPHN|nr:UDP-N-acetylglucosamine 2-epimerase (non-hydrolyzing) [Sphingomonas ginkgonis]RST31425.1 UDP-N-acetylglucosamine 2-epimerase (non-hydrolyzing) [Sphingomonas ginkgonis]